MPTKRERRGGVASAALWLLLVLSWTISRAGGEYVLADHHIF
jgi:hypothetical protein